MEILCKAVCTRPSPLVRPGNEAKSECTKVQNHRRLAYARILTLTIACANSECTRAIETLTIACANSECTRAIEPWWVWSVPTFHFEKLATMQRLPKGYIPRGMLIHSGNGMPNPLGYITRACGELTYRTEPHPSCYQLMRIGQIKSQFPHVTGP